MTALLAAGAAEAMALTEAAGAAAPARLAVAAARDPLSLRHHRSIASPYSGTPHQISYRIQ